MIRYLFLVPFYELGYINASKVVNKPCLSNRDLLFFQQVYGMLNFQQKRVCAVEI